MSLTLIYTLLFLSAFLSGISLLIFSKISPSKNLKLLLSFSGAFLLAICILHLIPEIYVDYQKSTGLFILLGFLIQLILEVFSKGIEHGHIHLHPKPEVVFPYALFLSLFVHSVIEGMALNHSNIGVDFNNQSLLFGIIIHKIPIAIVLVTLLKANKLQNGLIITALTFFALSAPMGLFLSDLYGEKHFGNPNFLIAIAVGVFLHISTTILFETSENHKFNIKKYTIILLGLIAATLTL